MKTITKDDLLLILNPKNKPSVIFMITNRPVSKYSTEVINASTKSGSDIKPGEKVELISIQGKIIPNPGLKGQKVDLRNLTESSAPIEWSIGTSEKSNKKGTGFIYHLKEGFLKITGNIMGKDYLVEIFLEY